MENELKFFMENAFTFGLDFEEPADSEDDQNGFYWLINKFEDMICVSFSLPEHDNRIVTYLSDTCPPRDMRVIYCPISGPQQRAPDWQGFSLEVREAIRRGFRRGLGRLFKLKQLELPENWAAHKMVLGDRAKTFLEMVKKETAKKRHYGLAQEKLAFLIDEAFNSFEYIPYHPNFDRAFEMTLAAIPLHGIYAYVEGVCLSNSLNTETGLAYLSDLATEVAEVHWHSQSTELRNIKLERVRTCLAEIQAKGAPLPQVVTPTPLVYLEKPADPIKFIELKPTIESLCIYPFCESDMNLLLLHLGAIAEVEVTDGAKTTYHVVSKTLRGKAKGIISAFPAAFGVLSQAKMFSGDKKKWSVAAASAYGQPLGRRVLDYEKSIPKDNRKNTLKEAKPGSSAFDRYTRKAEDWLFSWQERLEPTPNGRY